MSIKGFSKDLQLHAFVANGLCNEVLMPLIGVGDKVSIVDCILHKTEGKWLVAHTCDLCIAQAHLSVDFPKVLLVKFLDLVLEDNLGSPGGALCRAIGLIRTQHHKKLVHFGF